MELFGRLERKQLDVAILVHVDFEDETCREELTEFLELVESAGAEQAELIKTKRDRPDAKLYIGSGKLDEVAAAVALHKADVVIFNHALSPGQERNIERVVKARVIDRVGLILDIFAQRARSHEGKLQVELAQLRHMSTRLVRGWTHLERQKGGIGLRGPGETQLESDKRLLQERIKHLLKRIDKVRKQRALGRQSRQRSDHPTITLVGYTNAGKSTLFNLLTAADVYAENRLFATLDATLRSVHLPGGGKAILADTVGFIRHIPHDLVTAFRSTLEETSEADLLIHLVDAADPLRDDKIAQVEQVINEVGAADVPQLIVFNKIDLLQPTVEPHVDYDEEGQPTRVWVSAQNNLGIAALKDALASFFKGRFVRMMIKLGPAAGHRRAQLYALGKVEQEICDEQGVIKLQVYLTEQQYDQVLKWPECQYIEKLQQANP
ncbi:ribosome rescue GTPase HflX [Thiomicrospira cyclica]|jgi:GTP-binding protein HflX|uniref:GTPase HflX n=1 Tax=Thiomicrospira cyclica (strain DSM 14477 / JCM 11371 / ALM1) TaxID=717773 RepID=F6DBP9_THICA|nr:ribosome rescue GTPase HflX [Thiomicrospira cyclica]AEG31285.1 GTP-binding proten HflX [Thiomicrospira cyclica ALM1]